LPHAEARELQLKDHQLFWAVFAGYYFALSEACFLKSLDRGYISNFRVGDYKTGICVSCTQHLLNELFQKLSPKTLAYKVFFTDKKIYSAGVV